MTYGDQNRNQSQMDPVGLIHSICNVHATSIAVFIRKDFGREALSSNSLMTMAVLFFLSAGNREFLIFLGLFFVAQIYRRIETMRLLRRGVVWHSRYAGYPYLAMKVPFVEQEKTARVFVEPAICALAGVTLCGLSLSVGTYVFYAAISFMIREGIEIEIDRKRKMQMQDAKIEHEWYSEDLRR